MIGTYFFVKKMKKRLLHIVLYLPYGGLERIVYDFSMELNNRDYEVHVAALEKGGPIGDQLQQEGIPVHVLGKRPGKFDIRLLVRLIDLIKILKIQVIHSHNPCIMYAALAGKFAGVSTVVHTEHGRYLPDTLGEIWEDRLSSRLISKYVCVSKELEEYMLNVVKVPSKKLVRIVNGVNTSLFRRYAKDDILKLREKHGIPPDTLVLGTVCRLIRAKNIGFLIDWMKNNYNVYKKLLLLIVGDGPQFDEWRKQAKEVPGSRIRFLGSRRDITDLLNIFNIFTLVSTTEGTSLTILEAMSTQLPVIVSDVGGNRDIVKHKETGYLFECNNLDDFGECLKSILIDSNNAREMCLRARCSVEKQFSLRDMLTKYCKLYQ